MALYDVAGLDQKIELPVPLIISLMPVGQTKQRPGIMRQVPGFWVQHETGNPNPGAGALMHRNYMANGAPDNLGRPQTLSYHFTVDDRVIYQMLPVTEVSWQAADGGGPGNMSGISCELCINPDSDKATARRNAEALAGGVMRALGMESGRVKRHWDFNGTDPGRHHCPDLMMRENYWPTFLANVDKVIHATGQIEAQEWARPVFPEWWSEESLFDGEEKRHGGAVWHPIAATYTALKDTRCTAWASGDAPNTRRPVRKGEKVRGYYRLRANDGKWYVVTRGGSRLRASSLSPFITVKE